MKSLACQDENPYNMICDVNYSCTLDSLFIATCQIFPSVSCEGEKKFNKVIPCKYCYQLPLNDIYCQPPTGCKPSLELTEAYCKPLKPCMGNSLFLRNTYCQKSNKSLRIAVLLSLFLGGFGVDRFYLGYYLIGAFKFITLGGFGLAYMIDLILIVNGYLGPTDDSLYPERF